MFSKQSYVDRLHNAGSYYTSTPSVVLYLLSIGQCCIAVVTDHDNSLILPISWHPPWMEVASAKMLIFEQIPLLLGNPTLWLYPKKASTVNCRCSRCLLSSWACQLSWMHVNSGMYYQSTLIYDRGSNSINDPLVTYQVRFNDCLLEDKVWRKGFKYTVSCTEQKTKNWHRNAAHNLYASYSLPCIGNRPNERALWCTYDTGLRIHWR